MKIFQETLIKAFEVIVQPPKHTFEIAIYSILEHCQIASPVFSVNLVYFFKACVLPKLGGLCNLNKLSSEGSTSTIEADVVEVILGCADISVDIIFYFFLRSLKRPL